MPVVEQVVTFFLPLSSSSPFLQASSGENGTGKTAQIRVAVLTAGPSPERGISLNSARAALDALQESSRSSGAESPLSFVIEPVVFIDLQRRLWTIPPAALYSNTPDVRSKKLDAS